MEQAKDEPVHKVSKKTSKDYMGGKAIKLTEAFGRFHYNFVIHNAGNFTASVQDKGGIIFLYFTDVFLGLMYILGTLLTELLIFNR